MRSLGKRNTAPARWEGHRSSGWWLLFLSPTGVIFFFKMGPFALVLKEREICVWHTASPNWSRTGMANLWPSRGLGLQHLESLAYIADDKGLSVL